MIVFLSRVSKYNYTKFLYMFRLSTLDAKNIVDAIDSRFEKITVFLDIDNLFFDLYYDSIYADINDFLGQLRKSAQEVLYSLFNFQQYLVQESQKNNLKYPTIILYTNFSAPNKILKIMPKYKQHRQILKTLPSTQLIKFLKAKYGEFNVNEIKSVAKRYFYKLIQNIINNNFRNTVFVISRNMDSDYIPYLILKTYMKNTNAYFIVSWDKDYIQLLAYNNLFIYRRRNIKVENELIGDYIKVDYKILTGKNLDVKLKHPLLHPIYLALAGDSSDNIPSLRKRLNIKKVEDILNNYADDLIKAMQKESIDDVMQILSNIFKKSVDEPIMQQLKTNLIVTTFFAQDSLYDQIDKSFILNQLKFLNSYHENLTRDKLDEIIAQNLT
jgi:hypothetical protein